MSTEHKQQKKDQPMRVGIGFGISIGEWFISALVGIGSGLVTAMATIRSNFNDEVKHWPGVASIKNSAGELINEGLFTEHGNNLKRINEKYRNKKNSGDWLKHSEEIKAAKEEYAHDLAAFMKESYGIASRGSAPLFSKESCKAMTYGTWQRYNFSGINSDKRRILFNSVIGAVVGAGATLSFFNGVAVRHKIEKIANVAEEAKDILR